MGRGCGVGVKVKVKCAIVFFFLDFSAFLLLFIDFLAFYFSVIVGRRSQRNKCSLCIFKDRT